MTIISNRHHYLPVFFIEAFIFPSRKLWIYDKKKDTILPCPRLPNNIYEWSNNDIAIDAQKNDIIQTAVYKHIDNVVTRHFSAIQNTTIGEAAQQDYIDKVILMSAVAFFKTPAIANWTSKLADGSLNDTLTCEAKAIIDYVLKLNISQEDKHGIIFSISIFIDFFGNEKRSIKQHCKIVQCLDPCFILSDNPMLYKQSSIDAADFSTSAVIFPFTEKQVYYRLKNNQQILGSDIVEHINILLAIQATNYFASTDIHLLREVVTGYKIMKPFEDNIDEIKADLLG